MVTEASRDLEDQEGQQAKTAFQDHLDRPVSAAWTDFPG